MVCVEFEINNNYYFNHRRGKDGEEDGLGILKG